MYERYLVVSNEKIVAQVKIKDILWIERNLRKIRIVTTQETYEYYERIENVQPLLDQRFYPCLRGCYINFDQVKSMQEQKIIFDERNIFYLGRANFIKTRQAFKNYLKNKLELHKSACNYR